MENISSKIDSIVNDLNEISETRQKSLDNCIGTLKETNAILSKCIDKLKVKLEVKNDRS